jgi:hypothetical protein
MAADHPTTSLNYPNHTAASFRNVHLGPDMRCERLTQ